MIRSKRRLDAPNVTPLRTKGLIDGLIKGNQGLISPDHKGPRLFLGYVLGGLGGVG